ncbi:Hypothetical predicted protein [Podarcis lilfordi]|uniref:Snake toxin/toxin-like domain-containing protein n=1 Tax=Podarcis lilfordi TaxID=74358 RepID=A0AA35LGU7_9SAUR|nr:Hypothetical predicted protein [Podarcis lilfordi]
MTLGLLFLLCFELDEAIKCHVCDNVKEDNTCFHKSYICSGGITESCFTRRVSLGPVVVKIQRGCGSTCYTVVSNRRFRKIEFLCCKKSFCNTHNIWPETPDKNIPWTF